MVVVLVLLVVGAGAGTSLAEHREIVPTRGVGTTSLRSPPDVPAPSGQDPAHVTVAVVPAHTSVGELARVPGMGVGILSAGIGNVSAAQTYLDVGQGARVSDSLYDSPLPPVRFDARAGRVPAAAWRQIRGRASAVPADVVPGLLGGTLEQPGVSASVDRRAGQAGVMLAGENGVVPDGRGCRTKSCPTVTVVAADLSELRQLARHVRGDDLLIAVERPPPSPNHELAIGIAGRGFDGTLTSDSTRMRGLVLSTDLAPTVLGRLGIATPGDMTGEPIHTDGAVDAGYVQGLEGRLAVIGPRRAPVIGISVLIWVIVTALAGVAFRRRGLRVALPALAVTLAYLPAVLLLCAALEPSELAERLIAGIGTPALAFGTLRLASPFGALAIAGATSVVAYGADVVAGSHLTELSLIGPNPAGGVRFYGIGNELEATLCALVPIATGAALAAWAPRASARTAAFAFGVAGLLAVAAFAPGRFGADVGAAVGIPIGAAVAIGVCLQARRWRLLWLVAAPLAVLCLLVAVDLASGGDAHLTRTILRAGGLDNVGQVLQRRLELSAQSFSRYAHTVVFWIVVALIVLGVAKWRSIQWWFRGRGAAWAGFLGAVAATLVGTLANDSGALLLMIGGLLVAVTAGVAWAANEGTHRLTLSAPFRSVP